MVKYVWQKSGLWDKFIYAGLFLNFVLQMIIFATAPNLHQFIHAGLWLLLCFFVMSANYYRLAYKEFEPIRRLGEDIDALIHICGTLLIKKDGDGYTITSFSDGDSEGDN